MPTVHLMIQGKVQGVFYRANAKKKAEELGLTGWVQNTDDGNVEAVATGTQPSLDAFIEWCRHGPSRAKVAGVTVSGKEDTPFEAFTIHR